MQIFATPDLYGDHGWHHGLNFDQFARLMAEPSPPAHGSIPRMLSMPFPRAQSWTGGFIARQASRTGSGVAEWRFSWSGASVITLPLPSAMLDSVASAYKYLDGYDHGGAFVEQWIEQGVNPLSVVDLSLMCAVFVSTFQRVRDLLELCKFPGFDGELTAKIRARNVGQLVPFIDTELFVQHIKSHALPFASEDSIQVPGAAIDHNLSLKWKGQTGIIPYLDATWSVVWFSHAMGIPWGWSLSDKEEAFNAELVKHARQWMDLIARALEVNARRQAQHAQTRNLRA